MQTILLVIHLLLTCAMIGVILIQRSEVRFRELFGKSFSKNELIATFLAILELVRSKFAIIAQEKQFGEILISKV